MARILRVELSEARTPMGVHKFHNFAEDVYRDQELKTECTVSLEEMDGPTGIFHLRAIRKRFVRMAAARVREIAEKHYLLESIKIVEMPAE